MATVNISKQSKSFDFDIANIEIKSIFKSDFNPVFGGADKHGDQILTLRVDNKNYVEVHGKFDFQALLTGGDDAIKKLSELTLVENGKSFSVTGLAITSEHVSNASAFSDYIASLSYKIDGNDSANRISTSGKNDRIDAANGDDFIFSFAGKDRIDGGLGNDRIDGGADADLLTGGKGADIFIFTRGSGRDVITDFEANGKGHDVIDLSDYDGISKFKDIDISHKGNNVTITLDGGDTITLKGVDYHDLGKSDFDF